jgi:hypothetical protein
MPPIAGLLRVVNEQHGTSFRLVGKLAGGTSAARSCTGPRPCLARSRAGGRCWGRGRRGRVAAVQSGAVPETILLTGAANPVGAAIAAAIARAGDAVRPTDAVDLTDPALAAGLVAGVDAIVHLAPRVLADTLPAAAPGDLLDLAARGTHVLYRAALEAGVTRAVQASSLAVMNAYPDELEVTEQWRPRPSPDPIQLGAYLAELVAREFTRDPRLERPLEVVCLRFSGFAHLAAGDAAEAVVGALAWLRDGSRARGHRFQLFHISPLTPTARYTSALAQRTLGYGQPR